MGGPCAHQLQARFFIYSYFRALSKLFVCAATLLVPPYRANTVAKYCCVFWAFSCSRAPLYTGASVAPTGTGASKRMYMFGSNETQVWRSGALFRGPPLDDVLEPLREDTHVTRLYLTAHGCEAVRASALFSGFPLCLGRWVCDGVVSASLATSLPFS